MRNLEKQHLRTFCLKNDIDMEYIDSELTYEENMLYLKSMKNPYRDMFTLSNDEIGLARGMTREERETYNELLSSQESFEHRRLFELYGISESELDTMKTPFMVFNFYFRVPYHLSPYVKMKLKPFGRVVTWYSKFYFKVCGTKNEILAVSNALPVGIQLFKRDKDYQKGVIFTGEKWARLPEIGIPLKVQFR